MNKQDIINIILAVVSLAALYIALTKCNRDNFTMTVSVPTETIQNTLLTSDSQSITSYDVPIGSILIWPSTEVSSLPTGWLFCDGSTFTIGANTYTLPNLCGKFVVGAGAGKNSGSPLVSSYNIGNSGGEEAHRLTIDEIPAHQHDYDVVPSDIEPNYNNPNYGGVYKASDVEFATTYFSGGRFDDSPMDLLNTTNPHNNLPPYLALAYIIKVSNGPVSNAGKVQGNGMNNSS